MTSTTATSTTGHRDGVEDLTPPLRRRSARARAKVEAAEAERLVRAFLEAGGQVTACPPGDALATPATTLRDRLRRMERVVDAATRGEG